MGKKRFGQNLINAGLVDEESVLTALNIQKKQKNLLGKIAMEEKGLSVHQIFEILTTKIDSDKRFGEIAASTPSSRPTSGAYEPQVGKSAFKRKIPVGIGLSLSDDI